MKIAIVVLVDVYIDECISRIRMNAYFVVYSRGQTTSNVLSPYSGEFKKFGNDVKEMPTRANI